MYDYQDTLAELDKNTSLSEKLKFIHGVLKKRFSFIARIAVALYDQKTDTLTTFVDSSGSDRPLAHYQARLGKTESLRDILIKGRPRVVNDLGIFAAGHHEHTRKIQAQGYKSSYTLPMYQSGEFFGFTFFNSYEKDSFNVEVLHHLNVFGHLISLMVANELVSVKTLFATLQAARHIAHFRSTETGSHLDRMSHYCRLIAVEMADQYQFTDEYIEHIFLFSPLHDIGKIGVPDRVLEKPGKLTEAEVGEMRKHTELGREIVDTLMEDFGLDTLPRVEMLRNIAYCHHESVNGGGYPQGLKGDQIPIEARIIAVADVFDALTSRRAYKERWTNDEAFAMLERLSSVKLDGACVQALMKHRDEIEEIQRSFEEDRYG